MVRMEQGLGTKVLLKEDVDQCLNMMEITHTAKSNSYKQDDAPDIEMCYSGHEDVIKIFFVEDDIAFVVEVKRSVVAKVVDK